MTLEYGRVGFHWFAVGILGVFAQVAFAETSDVETALVRMAPALREVTHEEVVSALTEIEAEHGLDPLLVLSVAYHESRLRARARGPSGALGWMQVRPFVAEDVARRRGIPWRGPASLYDPVTNLRIGAAYLAELFRDFGEQQLALAAYNMGPTALRRLLRQGRRPRGRYAQSVLAIYAAIAGAGELPDEKPR